MKIKLLEIKKSEVYTKEETTYDLEVVEDNSYNVNGILVHNSACLTRKQTGCGVPMVSLILECADVAHSIDGHICADGMYDRSHKSNSYFSPNPVIYYSILKNCVQYGIL